MTDHTDATDEPTIGYRTDRGVMYVDSIESFVDSQAGRDKKGEVQLIFTSPPFILNRKKGYGNEDAEAYTSWLSGLAPRLVDLLTPTGSIVIELGNAWVPGSPTMSTLPLEALLAFKKAAGLHLCQQFVWHNPAKLPSPAQWVNVDRIRVRDSFTNIWWLSATDRPKANNRNVLVDYSDSMKKLLRLKKYNAGKRDSGWNIGEESFFTDNGGAIPPSVLTVSNTRSKDPYRIFCKEKDLKAHPATMPIAASDVPQRSHHWPPRVLHRGGADQHRAHDDR